VSEIFPSCPLTGVRSFISFHMNLIFVWLYCWSMFLLLLFFICSILSNFQIQWDIYIVWLSLASRRLYNILYLLWLYNEFFIILYNILKIAELDCCQIIILTVGKQKYVWKLNQTVLELDFRYYSMIDNSVSSPQLEYHCLFVNILLYVIVFGYVCLLNCPVMEKKHIKLPYKFNKPYPIINE
jgi:hypothetical protein